MAPEFVDTEQWFNTPGDKPLTLARLRGRVVLVDFWTYSCINCIRTLPYLKAWDAKYRKDGLTIVGVHTPEFPFEREAGNVETAIDENGIRYPVAQDNEQATWNAYGNQYWPAEYFIDAQGRVRYVHFGEGEYGEKEKVIRELLAEAGQAGQGRGDAGPRGRPLDDRDHAGDLPRRRPRRTLHQRDALARLARLHRAEGRCPANEFAYHGKWRIALDSATAGPGASLDLNFGARRVYLVLGSPGRDRKVQGAARRAADLQRRRRLRRPRRRRHRRPASASTTSSTCPGSATTSSPWNRKRGWRAMPSPSASRESARPGATIAAMADSAKGTVLVVDDEPTILDVVGRYMERAGYETYRAADGPEALRLAAAHRPDLVVLDLMLPGIDGIEVMRQLHEAPGPRIAVILLTARGEESDRLVGLRQGADDYVVKPFSPAELVARVDACCAASRRPTRRRRRSSTGRCGSSRRPAASSSTARSSR